MRSIATPFVDAARAPLASVPVVIQELPGMTVAYPKGWVVGPSVQKESSEGHVYYYKMNSFNRPIDLNPPKIWASILLTKGIPARRADSSGQLHPTLQEFRDDIDCGTHRKISTFDGGECSRFIARIGIAGTDGYLYADQGKPDVPGSKSTTVVFMKNDFFYAIAFQTPADRYNQTVPYLQSFIEHLVVQ